MILSPRYEGPTVVTIDGDPRDVLAPLVRQRARLAEIASTFTADQWAAPSRCEGWSVRDVIAHLAGINPLYVASTVAGLEGRPTRMMTQFDPAASPPQMVDMMRDLSAREVLEHFVTSNATLFATVEQLTPDDWSATAESPLGEVSVRLVMSHALWDAWVHERDVLLPLDIEPEVVPDEVVASLRYVAALTQGFAFGAAMECPGRFGIEATAPDFHCVMQVAESVSVHHTRPDPGMPVLRGDAVALTEALSTRTPMPADAPIEWHRIRRGLEFTWDLVPEREPAT